MATAAAKKNSGPSASTLKALAGRKLENREIEVSKLLPWENNPRRHIDDDHAANLGDSMITQGQIQNLIVRPHASGNFEVIVGNRRLRGMTLKLAAGEINDNFQLRCTIADIDDETAQVIAVAENMQRQSMNPIEECEALASIAKANPDVNALAKSIGLKPLEVAERIAVSNLEPEVKDLIATGKRKIEWGRAMTRAGATLRKEVMESIAKSETAYVSVQQIAALLRQKNIPAKNALFNVDMVGLKVQEDLLEPGEGVITDKDAFWVAQNAEIRSLERDLEREGHAKVITLRNEVFRDYEYETVESPENAIAVIEVASDGLVTVHRNLQRRGESTRIEEPEDDFGGGGSIFTADASDVPDVDQVSVTEMPPNSKASEYLADLRMGAAAGIVSQDPRMSRAIIIAGLLGNRDIGMDWPVYLRQGAELEAYNAIVAEAEVAEDLFAYALSLDDAAQEKVLALCASVRVRHQIGRKAAFVPDSPVSRVLIAAKEDGHRLRDTWTPNEEFLSLLTTQELRNLTTELLDMDEAGDVSHASKTDLVVLLSEAFSSAKTGMGRYRATTEIRLNAWLPSYM